MRHRSADEQSASSGEFTGDAQGQTGAASGSCRSAWRGVLHRLRVRVVAGLCAAHRDAAAAAACALVANPWEVPLESMMGRANAPRCRGVMEAADSPKGLNLGRHRLASRARRLLRTLGSTPSAVAESLLVAGVHGEPGDPEAAPLPAFLSVVIGADPAVESVTAITRAVTIARHAHWHREVTVAFPSAVAAFAEAFHAGCYPELRRERGRKDR